MCLEADWLGALGHAWATGGGGDGVETVGSLVVEPVHEVAVTVDGHLDRRVPESGLNGLGMLAGRDQPRGVGVAQVVDPAGRSYRLRNGVPPDPPERPPAQEAALFGGPDHSVDRRMLLESWAAVPRLSGRLRLDRRAANSQRPRFYDDVAAKEVLEGVFA